MRIGYARVSTPEQKLDMQVTALKEAGCERIFEEKASGRSESRPELKKMLDFIREGDTLVVWKLDRLGRTMSQLVKILADFEERGIGFSSLTEGLDTSTPIGKCMFGVAAAFAQMESDLARERTMAGLEEARRNGHQGGRSKFDPEKVVRVDRLIAKGESVSEACRKVGIGRSTYYKHKSEIEKEGC